MVYPPGPMSEPGAVSFQAVLLVWLWGLAPHSALEQDSGPGSVLVSELNPAAEPDSLPLRAALPAYLLALASLPGRASLRAVLPVCPWGLAPHSVLEQGSESALRLELELKPELGLELGLELRPELRLELAPETDPAIPPHHSLPPGTLIDFPLSII